MISPGGSFPSYGSKGREGNDTDIWDHIPADVINHLFYIPRHRWLEVKATQMALEATNGPVLEQIVTSARLPSCLPIAELLGVRATAPNSSCAYFSPPSQTSTPATLFFPATWAAYTFIFLVPISHGIFTMFLLVNASWMRTLEGARFCDYLPPKTVP